MPPHRTPPWEKPRRTTAARVKLTPESIAWARTNARRHGRRYPNLVDNMAAARRQLDQEYGRSFPDPGHP